MALCVYTNNNMKRISLFLVLASLSACGPVDPFDNLTSDDKLTAELRAAYQPQLLGKDFQHLTIECEGAGATAQKVIVKYKFGDYPERALAFQPEGCEVGPAVKIAVYSGRYSPPQVYAYDRRNYKITAIAKYIDAVIVDQTRDHL